MEIRTKKQFYDLWYDMRFGNRLRAWRTAEEAAADPAADQIAVRYMSRGSRWCTPCVPRDKLLGKIAEFVRAGADSTLFTFADVNNIREQRIALQGEVQRSVRYIELYYSLWKTWMRPALAEHGEHAHGVEAVQLLHRHLWEPSFEDLVAVLDEYPDSVVEFTAYDREFGVIPGRNAVIWEVRNY